MTALVLPWKFSVTFLKRCLCENLRAKFNITCLIHSSGSHLHHSWKSWILTCVSTTETNVFSNIHKHQCTWYAAVRLFKYTNLCLVWFIPNKLENIYMQFSVKLSPWILIVKSLAGSFMAIPVQLVPMQITKKMIPCSPRRCSCRVVGICQRCESRQIGSQQCRWFSNSRKLQAPLGIS